MALNAEVFRMIPPICLGRVPVECAVPPRPSPAARIGLGTAAPTPRTRPLAPPRQGAHSRNPARESDPAGGRTSPRRIRPPNREGYSAGGGAGAGVRLLVWWQFPRGRRRVHGGALLLGPLKFRWTICVRLDHLRSVGPPYFVNQVVQRNASGPTAFKWSKQTGRVTTCETPSHHAGRPVGRSRRGTPEPPRRRNRPAARAARLPGPDDPSEPDRSRRPARRSRRARLPQHTRRRLERVITAGPASPRSVPLQSADTIVRDGAARFPALRAPPSSTTPRITPGKRVQTPLNNLPGEEDSSKQTITATFTLHASKTTPEQPFATPGEKGSAHVMRAQRNRIHPGSRDASPARHNPPRLDSREPASHNAR